MERQRLRATLQGSVAGRQTVVCDSQRRHQTQNGWHRPGSMEPAGRISLGPLDQSHPPARQATPQVRILVHPSHSSVRLSWVIAEFNLFWNSFVHKLAHKIKCTNVVHLNR
jgi:hypothetical protein